MADDPDPEMLRREAFRLMDEATTSDASLRIVLMEQALDLWRVARDLSEAAAKGRLS